ncbi:MAG: PIN domain-containing protein [Cyanobacteriota bacterium]|nr:PIN domain-containing protein [Cyanobacteriota bacterium]
MANFTVVYDANVLYSAVLRDFFVELALTEAVEARWTEEIHSEWMRNVLKNRPDITRDRLTRTKNLMDFYVTNSLVTGYEEIIPELELPDAGDRHVLAAAIRCDASLIITFNLRDFPSEVLAPYDLKAQHPDDFVLDLLTIDRKTVCQAAEKQRRRLKNPPKTIDEYLATLEQQGLIQSAALMRQLCYQN